ncbi:hypothetical protein [Nocardia callitridis]|uniref:Uncharacterized protein n=1 Tax=Nocardia callitridis TaxID=648753 RepID=A0ABP9K2J0_9NOCA
MPELPTAVSVIVITLVGLWTVFVALPHLITYGFTWRRTAAEPECHAAPEVPFTAEQASRVMQILINCDVRTCERKRAAYWTWVDTGHAKAAVEVRR